MKVIYFLINSISRITIKNDVSLNGEISITSLSQTSDCTPYVAYQDAANGNKATVMVYK